MKTNPIIEVQRCGQSIWYDFISRDLLLSGELRRLVEHEGVLGVTSNPAIFEKAIGGSSDYDPATAALVAQGASDAKAIFEDLAIQDIQLGCDVLRPVYDRSQGADGFVSLEVSPHLAHESGATIEEAQRLWHAVARPNLMVKVPATAEGLPAIEHLIGQGVNVNATLLFAVDRYEEVREAYLTGLEKRLAAGKDPAGVASVASFFVSRIDAVIEKAARAALEDEPDASRRTRLQALIGRVAIANALEAYARFRDSLAAERWRALAARGARPQRLLWASTGTKSPELPAALYVEALIGPDTVNTVPATTLEAFRKEGRVRNALAGEDAAERLAEARVVLSETEALGFSLREITDELLAHGCQLFCDAFDQLLATVESKRQQLARND